MSPVSVVINIFDQNIGWNSEFQLRINLRAANLLGFVEFVTVLTFESTRKLGHFRDIFNSFYL